MITFEDIKVLLNDYEESESEIILIKITGSSIFVPYEIRKNDIDIVVVCKNLKKPSFKMRLDKEGIHYDIFVREYNFIKGILNLEDGGIHIQYWNLFYNLGYIMYSKEDIKFDFKKHETAYVEVIKNKLKSIGFSEDFPVDFIPQYKTLSMALIVKHFIEKNITEPTEDIMLDVYRLYMEPNIEKYKEIGEFFGLQLNEEKLKNIIV